MTQTWPLARRKLWGWGLLILAGGGMLTLLSGILMPFILGILVAYILNPPVVRLQRMGVPRVGGTILLVLMFFLTLGGAFFVAIPFLQEELLILARLLPRYGERILQALWPSIEVLSSYVDGKEFANFHETIRKFIADMMTWALHMLVSLLTNTLAIANLMSLVILTPILVFYLLRDWPKILDTIDRLLPRDQAPIIRHQLSLMNQSLGGYLRGQVLVCFSLMIYYCLGLSLTGLNFSLTIGIITGLFAFIPYMGFLVGLTAGIGMAFAQFQDWASVGWVALVYGIGQGIESYLLTPKLVGERIGLHPVWIIFSLLTGGVLLGFMGLLIALPVAAAIRVWVQFGVEKYKQSPYYLSQKNPTSSLEKRKASSQKGKRAPSNRKALTPQESL